MMIDAANRRVVVQVRWWFCPEPYGSGFWFVFFGVIVPITPHTQNIMPSQNLLGVLREVEL